MSQITITINSREYPIACEDGQELRIMQLADMLDEKAKLLAAGGNQISESLLLAMVGLLLADELSEAKQGTSTSENKQNLINLEEMKQTDAEIAAAIRDVDNEIKKLALSVNSL